MNYLKHRKPYQPEEFTGLSRNAGPGTFGLGHDASHSHKSSLGWACPWNEFSISSQAPDHSVTRQATYFPDMTPLCVIYCCVRCCWKGSAENQCHSGSHSREKTFPVMGGPRVKCVKSWKCAFQAILLTLGKGQILLEQMLYMWCICSLYKVCSEVTATERIKFNLYTRDYRSFFAHQSFAWEWLPDTQCYTSVKKRGGREWGSIKKLKINILATSSAQGMSSHEFTRRHVCQVGSLTNLRHPGSDVENGLRHTRCNY